MYWRNLVYAGKDDIMYITPFKVSTILYTMKISLLVGGYELYVFCYTAVCVAGMSHASYRELAVWYQRLRQ